MRLPAWWKRKRIALDKTHLTRKGVWGSTPDTLLWMLSLTPELTFNAYDLNVSQTKTTRSHVENIDVLVKKLFEANVIIAQSETVETYSKQPEKTYTLDDFFISAAFKPIRPIEVVKTIEAPLKTFLELLLTLHSENDQRSGYYRRHYDRLLQDLFNLLKALIEVSDLRIDFSQ